MNTLDLALAGPLISSLQPAGMFSVPGRLKVPHQASSNFGVNATPSQSGHTQCPPTRIRLGILYSCAPLVISLK